MNEEDNNRREMIMSGILLAALIALFISICLELGVHIETAKPAAAEPTITETIVCGSIIPIEESPAAAEICTNTPTQTPAPRTTATSTFTTTPSPEPTATNTPKPAKTPTPKPTKAAAKISVPYPTGHPGMQTVDHPEKHQWKPYARYTKITAKGSREYKLQQIAETAENGLRVVTDPEGVRRYCIALEPLWAGGQSVDIGRCIDLKMANGSTLHCVLGDCKKTEHSQNGEGRYGGHGELVEFIADQPALPEIVRKCGDVSRISAEFAGAVVSVTVLPLYIEGFGGKK